MFACALNSLNSGWVSWHGILDNFFHSTISAIREDSSLTFSVSVSRSSVRQSKCVFTGLACELQAQGDGSSVQLA